jgi:predicted phosphoribosyltransferase
VIVVDDGMATGSTMLAAVKALRAQRAGYIVAAAPVAAPEACEVLRADADTVICACMPEPFRAVGQWYGNFEQTTDEEVQQCLAEARQAVAKHAEGGN